MSSRIFIADADGTIIQREVNGFYKHGTVDIRLTECDPGCKDAARIAIDTVTEGGSLCVLVNSVRTAQQVYDHIKSYGTDARVMLFHSRFSAERRKEIERECLRLFGPDHQNRPDKAILVATQVSDMPHTHKVK